MKKQNIPLYGQRLQRAAAEPIVHALRDVHASATRIHAEMSKAGIVEDPAADLVSAAAMADAARAAMRLPGIRDILVASHPVVEDMIARLATDGDRLPAPDDAIVTKLAKLDGFKVDGLIFTIYGVPVPAGARQTDWYMAVRYRALYAPGTLAHLVYNREVASITDANREPLRIAAGDAPDLVHFLAYDAAHTTDNMQETLLSYSTGIHRANLIALQEGFPELYSALWRRDMETAKTLVRRLRKAALPPSNPKSRFRFRSLRLILGTALMNEHERLFEVIDAVGVDHGVTRQSIADALVAARSMKAVRAAGDATHEHLAGAVVQVRSLHPTMNGKAVKPLTADPSLERARTADANTRGFEERTRRIRWIDGEMPGAWFCGVEPAFLAPVALIQMIVNMARRERGFWLRGARHQAADVDDQRRSLAIRLAVVITANICPATARSMLPTDAVDAQLATAGLSRTAEEWRDAVVPDLIANPRIGEEIEKKLAQLHDERKPVPRIVIARERDRPHHSSPYDRARLRTRAFFQIGQPGWTQGFFFEAWLRPDAEIAFLRNCCRYVQYSETEAVKREARNAALGTTHHADLGPVRSVDIATGLPLQHPVERIHDLFRDLFDRLELPDIVKNPQDIKRRAWRDEIIREVAPLLAAVSPITLDPQRAEWWWDDLDPDLKKTAVEGAWNT